MRGFRSQRRGLWRLMLLAVILLILGSYVTPVRSYLEKSTLIQREQLITGDLRAERDRLLQEKESLQNNSSYMEQVARKDLGMVKPGEQPYVVKDLNAAEATAAGVAPAVEEAPAADAAPTAGEAPAAEEAPLTDRIMEAVGSLIP